MPTRVKISFAIAGLIAALALTASYSKCDDCTPKGSVTCQIEWELAHQRPKPKPRKFFDAPNIVSWASVGVIFVDDGISTERARKFPGTHEVNPFGQTPGELMALKIFGGFVGLAIQRVMWDTHHYKAVRAIPFIFAAPSAAAAINNVVLARSKNNTH